MARRRRKKSDAKNQDQMPKRITEKRLLKAIKGSGGIISLIAVRLGCRRSRIAAIMKCHDWPLVEQALEDEREKVGDLAEQTVMDTMRQRLDLGTALRSARWYLERKHKDRGFTPRQEIQLEGGKTPITINNQSLDISQLPQVLREQLLEQLESKDGVNTRPTLTEADIDKKNMCSAKKKPVQADEDADDDEDQDEDE